MKKMKRVLVALLSCLTAFACLAGTVACGEDKKPAADNNNQSESSVDSSSKDDASVEAKPVGGCNGECNFEHVEELSPTCTEDGRAATIQCTECGYIVDPAPALLEKSAYACEAEYLLAKAAYIAYWSEYAMYGNEHDFSGEWTEYKAADCCNDGELSYTTCTICGVKNIEDTVIPATGIHTKEDFVEYTHAIPATCTEDGRTEGWVCKNGGVKEVEVLPAFEHTYVFDEESEDFVEGTVLPTCLTDAKCGRCGEVLEDTALGHNYVSVEAKAVTCLENGWEAYEYCDREGCAHTTFNFEVAAEMTAAKHWDAVKKAENFTEVAAVKASCTEAGNNKYFVCGECNLVRDSKNVTKNITATIEENAAYKPMLAHVLDTRLEDYVKEVKATCEVDGKKASGTCKNCENYVDGDVLPATGHSFEGENAVISASSYAASCTKDAKCSNANCDYKNGKIEDTAFGHTWVEVEDYFVSCTENGIRAHVECETCAAWALPNEEENEKKNDGWVDGYKEAAYNNNVYVLKALGHGYNNNWVKVEAKDATHAEAGWVEYYVCGICEDYANITNVEIPALVGHNCPDFGIDTCSRYFVCEDIVVVDEETGEETIVHYGCGIIFDNPYYIPCVDADEDGICDVCKNEACKHLGMINGYCDDCHYCEHIAHGIDGVCYECKAKVAHVYADVTYACSCGLVCAHTENHNEDLTCPDCGWVPANEAHSYNAEFVCEECGVSCQHEAGFDATDKCFACGMECEHESHDFETEECEVCDKVVAHNWVRDEEDGSDYCDLCGVTCAHDKHDSLGNCTDVCGNKVEHSWNLEADNNGNVACTVCGGKTALALVCPHDEHYIYVDELNATSYTVCDLCGTQNVDHIWESEDSEEIVCHCGAEWTMGTVITRGELTIDTNIIVPTANTAANSFAVKAQGEDTVVTISGGNYNGGSGSLGNIAIWADADSKVVITDGQFTVGKDKDNEANPTIYASNGATIEISGGTFFGVEGDDGRVWTLNCMDSTGAKIVVTGGRFYGFNPADSKNEPTNPFSYVAEGYTVVKGTDATHGDYWEVVEAE